MGKSHSVRYRIHVMSLGSGHLLWGGGGGYKMEKSHSVRYRIHVMSLGSGHLLRGGGGATRWENHTV